MGNNPNNADNPVLFFYCFFCTNLMLCIRFCVGLQICQIEYSLEKIDTKKDSPFGESKKSEYFFNFS